MREERRARTVAQALLGQPEDVCRYVDQEVSERVESSGAIGPVVLDRLVDEAMLRLHAEQRGLEQLESLDVRRSIALGILADPARAHALLSGDLDAKPSRVRELTASLHLTEGNMLGLDPVATDVDAKAHLDQVIREWAGRPDIRLVVTCPRRNLALLCRHHHRLKTHAGWRYWMVAPGTYLWRDPHGLLHLRTRDGTRPLD